MSFLTVAQDVATATGMEVPEAVVASSEREHVELRSFIKRCARGLRDACDWQELSTLQTMTGDGSTTAFALPSDYHRMPKDARLWNNSLETPLTHIQSQQKWLDLEVRQYDFVEGVYTIRGNQIHIKPAMDTGETTQFYYQSKAIWTLDSDSSNAVEPVADADTLRLDEELLTLRTIWYWKSKKGLPYAEDMAEAELALAEAVQRNRGPVGFKIGKPVVPLDAVLAYPQRVGT